MPVAFWVAQGWLYPPRPTWLSRRRAARRRAMWAAIRRELPAARAAAAEAHEYATELLGALDALGHHDVDFD